VMAVGGASLGMVQSICRDGTELVRLEVTIACVDPAALRPVRLPAGLRDRLAALASSGEG